MPPVLVSSHIPTLAAQFGIPDSRVSAVLSLLADGNTVPFIARYRKEATGGLDEVKIREIEERSAYLAELENRRKTILATISEQGKLTPELADQIASVGSKAELEDLYLPYKPKRKTRASVARSRGLEPLAERILSQPSQGDPQVEAGPFVLPEKEVPDIQAALQGARDIVAERIAEMASVRSLVREAHRKTGQVVTSQASPSAAEPTKFELYYDFRERLDRIPSHRYLAIRRGEKEGVLRVRIDVEAEPLVQGVLRLSGHVPTSPFASDLEAAVRDGYERLLVPSVASDIHGELKDRSDRAAIEVFAENLRNLLLAPPAGARSAIGIDPGLRTGAKCAAVDATGKFLGHVVVHLSKGDALLERANEELVRFIREHQPFALAVGNGTGSREAEAFAREALGRASLGDIHVVSVSEAGASVYSASDVAREEFPDLDLTIRGAISIARRLQDPLAELVKIEPRSIGVGQYQHDVPAPLLAKKLEEVVESCVNHVGVELNTASASLLSYVSGIGRSLAKKIILHRDQKGPFRSREELGGVPGLGPKTFEQAAGFLRIRDGLHPLDASAVHPERYELVARIAADLGIPLSSLVGHPEVAARIDVGRYVGDGVGEPTLRDIQAELSKPGRDPRQTFEPPRFRADVQTLEDLKPGLELEGIVTNVTAFGAFVDIGVHQDGLVHVSRLADRFVKDPHEVVRVGQRVRARVLEVDLPRKRIALSLRSREAEATAKSAPRREERESSASREKGGPRSSAAKSKKEGQKRRGQGDGARRERPGPDTGLPRPTSSSEILSYRPFEALEKKERKGS